METDLTKKAESEKTFKRIVIGGKEQAGARILPVSSKHNKKEYKLAEYTFKRKVDGSYASLMQVEQELKSLSWQQGQVWATESLVVSPVQKIISKKAGLKIHSLKDLSLELFQLNNHGNVIVAGPAAGIPSNFSELLKRPHHSIEFGTWVGKQASLMAKTIVKSSQVAVKVKQGKGKNVGQVKEFLNGLRGEMSTAKSFVLSPQRDLKVLGRFDTVVIGGGTGGAPAAIAAARNGAETLLVEFHHGLGGIGTMGLIGRYWYGNRVGFTKEVDEINDKRGWDSETKKEWLRKAYVEAGGTLWTGSIGSGALVEDGHVKGVIVTTPEGRGVVLCKTVIDSTGNCDIAIAAGAKYEFVNKDEFGMQGTGLSPLTPENSYTNSDWTFIDDMDMLDRKRAHVVAKLKFKGSWDMAQHIDTRERRHIIGDYYLSPIDIARGKTYPDNIVLSQSNWDSHGYSNHLLFKFWFPGRRDVIKSYVPYRCLLPKGLEGILVTGVGISAHRDSFAIIRMQPDVQNHGYAAGIASAIALQEEKPVRYISIRNLQKKLVKKGILDIAAAGNEETQEAGAKLVSAAVQNLAENYDGVWNILDAPRELSQAILLEALNDPKKSLKAAHILSYFGDDSGKEVLLKYLEESSWDNGWSMMGMGNHGSGYSSLDSIILGLAEADVKAAVPLIIEKMNQLKDESNFSHIRVCAMALEKLKTNVAGPALAQFLLKKEMRGHEILNYNDLVQKTPASSKDTIERRGSLRELILARALYNCGDVNGLGQKILETYANDLRGVYAIHARKVLGVK